MYRKLAVGWVLGFIVLMSLLPSIAFAAAGFGEQIVPCDGVAIDRDGDGVKEGTECTVCHIGELAKRVLNGGIYIAIFFSAIMFAWAGWKHVTAGGSASKAHEARSIFTNVFVGLIIILVGWLVVDTLMRVLLADRPTDPETGEESGMPAGLLRPWEPLCD